MRVHKFADSFFLQTSPRESPGSPRQLRWAAAVAASFAVIALVVFTLTSGSDAKQPYRSAGVSEAKQKLAARLDQRLLRPHWIACVPSGRSYHSAAVIRCNVNFGDPHIQAYCSVLRGDRLVTQYDDGAIPCGHDDAGWSAPVQTLN